MPDALPVELEAAGPVGVTLFGQPRRFIVHLVNHKRDSRFRSDAVESIGPVALRIRVPDGCRVQRVRRLWENRDVPFQMKDTIVSTGLACLDEYEAIAVEW
jgi:hypothetical protein